MLPILLWRALIPVGFMPMVGLDHSVRLVICDSYAPLPASLMDMSMDAGMDMSSAPHVHQDHGACPYGSSPALGAPPTFALSLIVTEGNAEPRPAAPDSVFAPLLTRAHSARAPPV